MRDKITYLLGAGASANAIPLVLQIPVHLSIMAEYIETHFSNNVFVNYVKDINELKAHLSEYNTIDSYARILSQNLSQGNKIQLAKLKSILCGLFMFEQLRKKKPVLNYSEHIDPKGAYTKSNFDKITRVVDPRYKSFFGKVLNQKKLNENISIISWNYDLQIEIGIENNIGLNYNELSEACTIYPHPACKSPNNGFYNLYENNAQIVKLNGTAGTFVKENAFSNMYLNQSEFFDDRLEVLLDIHSELSRYDRYNPFLRFAWEQDTLSKRGIEYANQIMSQTDVLVIIGYSFPDFNRSVDRQIFMNGNLDQIFLQVPENDFENVRDNMQSSFGSSINKVQLKKNLNEFYIPHQFIPIY